MASSPSLAKALTQLGGNLDGISQKDRIQVLALYRALFHIWSNAHRQYLNGTLDPALYASVIQEISTYAKKTPNTKVLDGDRRHVAIKWAWESEKFIYNPEFQQLMDSILNDE